MGYIFSYFYIARYRHLNFARQEACSLRYLKLCGTEAYVDQSPWMQSGKIEENILFGKEMDREKYVMVLEACFLRKDLEVLPFGDQAVISEQGINLSGRLKQRVQNACVLYEDADLLDDRFSAVDAHTGMLDWCFEVKSGNLCNSSSRVPTRCSSYIGERFENSFAVLGFYRPKCNGYDSRASLTGTFTL